jgi:hypothetical protein
MDMEAGRGYIELDLNNNPDEISEALMASMVQRDRFMDADLAAGDLLVMSHFAAALLHRISQRALERDEIIDFVERNRTALEQSQWIASLISTLGEVTGHVEKGTDHHVVMRDLVDTLINLQRALEGHPGEIDVISNRLLYLCMALGMKMESGDLTYNEAVHQWLDREFIKKLMSRTALMYMLADHLKHAARLDDSRTGHVMFVAECALLVDETVSLRAAANLLAGLPPPADGACWLDLQRRIGERLRNHRLWSADDEQSYARAVSRFAEEVPDDDL